MIITVYRCRKYPGKCLYKTSEWGNFQRHVATCTDETVIESKQVILGGIHSHVNHVMSCDLYGLFKISYGKPVDVLKNAITSGLLPESFVNYRQMNIGVFDIETLEEPSEDDDVEGILRIASIGFASIYRLAIDFSSEKIRIRVQP